MATTTTTTRTTSSLVLVLAGAFIQLACGDRAPPPNWPDPPPPTLAEPIGGEVRTPDDPAGEDEAEPAPPPPEGAAAVGAAPDAKNGAGDAAGGDTEVTPGTDTEPEVAPSAQKEEKPGA